MSASCHTFPRVFGHAPVTGAYNHFIYTFYNATLRNSQIYIQEGRAALLPHQLKGPATPSPAHAPPQHLLAALAPAGSSIKWSGWSPTTGHRRRGFVHCPLWMPTPAIVIVVRLHPACTSHHWVVLRGLISPILLPPHVHPPLAHHLPPASACPLPLRRSHPSRPGGGGF